MVGDIAHIFDLDFFFNSRDCG